MTVETLSKEAAQAVQYFETKLAFELGPVGLHFALKNHEPVQIVDLRTPELFAKGHIAGAINIAFDQLDNHLDKLKKDQTIVVYCYDIVCNLSTKAALHLIKKGYNAKELVGGFDQWAKHELKIEGEAATGSCSSSKSSCG